MDTDLPSVLSVDPLLTLAESAPCERGPNVFRYVALVITSTSSSKQVRIGLICFRFGNLSSKITA